MKKKQIVDLVIALVLLLCGCGLLIFPFVKNLSIKSLFIGMLTIYLVLNLIQFLLTKKSKDYEGLFTSIASFIVLIIVGSLDINKVPWYLALSLLIWIIFMSLIKLKKADYYSDRKKNIWLLKIITLAIFILTGILTTINLYYSSDVQTIVLGFFFLIHGILELMDPITIYLM